MSRFSIWALLLVLGCADGVAPPGEPCDDETPCAEGACVAGVCQPGDTPRPDSAATLGDAGPEGDMASPGDMSAIGDMASAEDMSAIGDMASPEDMASLGDMASLPADMASPEDMSAIGDMASPEDMAPPIDMAPPPPDMAPPLDCGAYGEACCPDGSCLTGGCVDGICAQFGGIWALYGEPGDDLCAGNPLTGGACACPDGFVDHFVEDVDGNVDEGSGWPTRIHVCGPREDIAGADFHGSIGEQTADRDPACAVDCDAQPGADCACPAGSEIFTYFGVRYRTNPNPDCTKRVTFCGSRAPLTFGGAFRSYRPTSRVCIDEMPLADRCAPNPLTGACTCPPGFDPVTLPMMGPHSVRGLEWFCRADLVVCVGRP